MMHSIHRVLAVVVLLTTMSAPVATTAAAERGPAVGQKIAGLLAATDQAGQARDFASLAGDRGVILLLMRSLHW